MHIVTEHNFATRQDTAMRRVDDTALALEAFDTLCQSHGLSGEGEKAAKSLAMGCTYSRVVGNYGLTITTTDERSTLHTP